MWCLHPTVSWGSPLVVGIRLVNGGRGFGVHLLNSYDNLAYTLCACYMINILSEYLFVLDVAFRL